MKKITFAAVLCLVLATAAASLAEVSAVATPSPSEAPRMERERLGELVAPGATAASAALPTPEPEGLIKTTKGKLTFVSQSRYRRDRTVTYYPNVYAVNHGQYLLQPFAASVPQEYFVLDEEGGLALAPIVLDVTDAMRQRLYGADVGETAMFYGQYCEMIRDMRPKLKEIVTYKEKKNAEGDVTYTESKRWVRDTYREGQFDIATGRVGYGASTYGYSGVHEGIDFVYEKGAPLHAILGGVVTRAGDSNGTVGIYSEDLDITLLYLHTGDIQVKRGDVVAASDVIGYEGGKGLVAGIYNNAAYKAQGIKHTSGSHYTHVELRVGRHTSSSAYTDAKLESDCPYEYLRQALNVPDSGRQPVTMAAVTAAQRMREEAEAKAAAEAAARMQATPEPTPEPIEIVEETPIPGYGFAETTPAPEQSPETIDVSAVPEATLPPTGK